MRRADSMREPPFAHRSPTRHEAPPQPAIGTATRLIGTSPSAGPETPLCYRMRTFPAVEVDAIQAFELVVGAGICQHRQCAAHRILSFRSRSGKGPSEGPLSDTAINLTPLKTVC